MADPKPNHRLWLERLDEIQYAPARKRQDDLEQLNLSTSLLTLARVNHDQEYQACRAAAENVLGKVPEPDLKEFHED